MREMALTFAFRNKCRSLAGSLKHEKKWCKRDGEVQPIEVHGGAVKQTPQTRSAGKGDPVSDITG
jgi:hypothetical protein